MKICTIDECAKKEFARGWCRMHWNRWRRHGDPHFVKRIFGDVEARINKFTARPDTDGCWTWTGTINYNGYARMGINGRKEYVHRVVYEQTHGPVPDGLDVDHECHNRDVECPGGWGCAHRRCVNPAHLVARTRGENMERAMNRG